MKCMRVFTDSQLVVGQVRDEYEAQDSIMAKYLDQVNSYMVVLQHFSISHIPRNENAQVDMLSSLATSLNNFLGQAYIKYLEVP